MGYFNYHAKIKNLMAGQHLVSVEIVDKWNGVSPAMVMYFDVEKPMPVRDYRWHEYTELIKTMGIIVVDNRTVQN